MKRQPEQVRAMSVRDTPAPSRLRLLRSRYNLRRAVAFAEVPPCSREAWRMEARLPEATWQPSWCSA